MLNIIKLIRLIGSHEQLAKSLLQATSLLDDLFGNYRTILVKLTDQVAQQQRVAGNALYRLKQEAAQTERIAYGDLQMLLEAK